MLLLKYVQQIFVVGFNDECELHELSSETSHETFFSQEHCQEYIVKFFNLTVV